MHADRHRTRPPAVRSVRVFDVVILAGFLSIVAFFAYDGFKEIFTKPVPFKPKQAEDSIAELKASMAKSKDTAHKYVQPARTEGSRSALQTWEGAPLRQPRDDEPHIVTTAGNNTHEGMSYTKVVVVSAMQEQACPAEGGDELHYLSVLNKQDYARIHGYEFVLGIKQVDAQLENMWNKPAWLMKVLEDETLHGEWILWMDIDTVVIDANFTLPYEEYGAKSKDLILYGNIAEVKAGHPLKALNTGVMLVRNTPWSRHFFSEVNRLGRLDDHHKGKATLSTILLKELQAEAYSDGLRDQNAVIYLLKTHPEWQDRVAFLDKEVCLNCYWRDLIGVTGFGEPDYVRQENVTFIQHFMGCQTCNALNRNGDLETCRNAMFHSFNFVETYQRPMMEGARPRGEKEFAQLRELPYCSLHTSAEGCAGAKPLDASKQAVAAKQYDWKSVDNNIVASTLMKIEGNDDHRADLGAAMALSDARGASSVGLGTLNSVASRGENRTMARQQRAAAWKDAAKEGGPRRVRHRKRVRVSASRGAVL